MRKARDVSEERHGELGGSEMLAEYFHAVAKVVSKIAGYWFIVVLCLIIAFAITWAVRPDIFHS